MLGAAIVHNQDEVDQFYHYTDKSGSPKAKLFPCIIVREYEDGGLGGSYYDHSLVYPPPKYKRSEADAWLAGVVYGLRASD